MMNRRLIAGVGAALATMVATACEPDKLTTVNDNPNNPTDAPSTALFTNAARNAVDTWLDGVGGTRYAFLSQHFAEAQYPESDAYIRLRANTTSAMFNSSYSNELQDLELIIQRGLADDEPGLYAPAMVLQAWEFGILTDVFGDIPYSEAFKADSGILAPAYDEQAAIYADLFVQLGTAATDLTSATNELGTADPIYAGAPAKWQKFANSLRARHALRLINVDAAKANTELTAAFAGPGGLITTNADNAAMAWPGDGVYDNPWAANFKSRDDHRISTRLLRYLRDYADPRVAVFAMPIPLTAGGTPDTVPTITDTTLYYCPSSNECYGGLANALSQAAAAPLGATTSRLGEIFFPGVTTYGTFGGSGGAYPSYLMTAAEVEFIRAEAAQRNLGGLASAQAVEFYRAGIRRSMEQWGVAPADTGAYLAARAAAFTAAGNVDRLKQIAIQKWIALYADPIQAWSEFRRTCQPAILKPGPEAVEDEIPRRLYYSTTDRAANRASYDEAVERQGPDNFLTRIYWDKNPTAAPTYEAGCGMRD
jgi:hypothetical protein